ncbi:MAG: hypothetical protein QXX68_01350 [Candidatus Pacearchaeota archaeon]
MISFYISKSKKITPSTSEVSISTDKNNYDKGEIINIFVKNGLNKPILYYGGGNRFWGIEYFNGSDWINNTYEKGSGFQLTKGSIGDDCYIILYEREYPSEIKSQDSLWTQWNQKICPFETEDLAKPRSVRYIERGLYRLIFHYGFEISQDAPFKILNVKTIYSNNFTIK